MALDGFEFRGPNGVNVAECLRVADLVEQSETFNMGDWGHECGTPACIAGHIVSTETLARVLGARKAYNRHASGPTCSTLVVALSCLKSEAAAVLGIGESAADALFVPPMRIQDSADGVWAAACLRNLAATGNVDWEGTRP